MSLERPGEEGVSSGNKEPPKVPLQRWTQVRRNSRGHSARGMGEETRLPQGEAVAFFMGRPRWPPSHSRTVSKEALAAERRRRAPPKLGPFPCKRSWSRRGCRANRGGGKQRASLEGIGFGGKALSPLDRKSGC